ncbi:MAG: hypothetical protein E7376_05330 [Clostridiales bacterium]|nr:hypothetical protein [Clostridiales bacterium]
MEKFITIKDIRNFLYQNDIIWDSRIRRFSYNAEIDYMPAEITDFGGALKGAVKLFMENNIDEYFLFIDNFMFEIKAWRPSYGSPGDYDIDIKKDLSKKWMEFLLKEHREDYSLLLQQYCNKRIKHINDCIAYESKLLQDKIDLIKANGKSQIEQWQSIKNLINKVTHEK